MNLQPRKQDIVGGKEFLRNTQGLEYKTAGLTLLASDFTVGEYVKAGTAVYIGEDGLGHKWKEETEAAQTAAGLRTHDVRIAEKGNPVVGVLVAGHPLESRCTGVNAAFKEAVKGRITFEL